MEIDWPAPSWTPGVTDLLAAGGRGFARKAGEALGDIVFNKRFKMASIERKLGMFFKKEALANQSDGQRRAVSKTVRRKVSKFRSAKLNNMNNSYYVQHLGVRLKESPRTWGEKHLVSEFNPTQGGRICIANDSYAYAAPMHIYDLNYACLWDRDDTQAGFPVTAASGRCTDINSRSWLWNTGNYWEPNIKTFDASGVPETFKVGGNAADMRYYVDQPRGQPAPYSDTTRKLFRKGIDIKFMAYGCRKMPTEFEFRVIKITDPNMCPDNPEPLTTEDLKVFQQNWQNMCRAWTQNPILRGVEPGPKSVNKWFKTVAVKRINLGESTADVETIPCVQSRIKLELNQLVNYAWTNRNFDVENGPAKYDNIPTVEDVNGNNNFNDHSRPYYTSRYYLLVRALSCVDIVADATNGTTGNDGEEVDINANLHKAWNYSPSYDLIVRTSWIAKTGHNY